MATYLWSDLHFHHEGIIGYCGRRDPRTGRSFESVARMNQWLVETWNNRVLRESDIVWVLGDFAFPARPGGEPVEVLFHRLRGIKRFVVGNHDEKNKSNVLRLPWDNAEQIVGGGIRLPHLVTFRDNGRRAELCHYPLETWKGAAKGALMLHGHSHGSLKRVIPHRFDVGVDTELGAEGPIDFEKIWEIAMKQNYAPQDHHAEKRPEVEL